MSKWKSFNTVDEMNKYENAIEAYILSRDPDYSESYLATEEKRQHYQSNWDRIKSYIEEHGLMIEDWHGIFERLRYREEDGNVAIRYVPGQWTDGEYITLAEHLSVKNSSDSPNESAEETTPR